MVLPLPVPPRPAEEAVRFINLKVYPEFFDHLKMMAFPVEILTARSLSMPNLYAKTIPLVIHEVGDFEASFVPGLDDFEQLDPRFRIPRTVLDELPAYQGYGFAVFKLKASTKRHFRRFSRGSPQPETRKVHPMAFEFPRRQPELLYFPTLHVHDRIVHPGADFDHVLCCQPEPGWDDAVHLRNWSRSQYKANRYIDVSNVQGLVNPVEHLFRRQFAGRRQNKDTWVSVNSTYPEPVPT